ncbi:MAG TPA: HAD-IIA family hydrolase [Nocardioides sp.]
MSTTSATRLVDGYDLVMLDLDGVVYVGPDAVPGASVAIRRLKNSSTRLAFVTNNASRTPDRVAAHLTELDIPAEANDVVTSGQAAAGLLTTLLAPGSPVFLLGSPALAEALEDVGLVPVQDRVAHPVAVVSGYAPDIAWRLIMEGAVLVRDGLPWVASNTDLSVPTAHGVAPGHGVLVKMISEYADREPLVAGKPRPPLLQETVRRLGGSKPLMVGDRLDTDIEGASAIGVDSLLVLTGVTGLAELAVAPPNLRPTWISRDLGGLFGTPQKPAALPGSVDHRHRLGEWEGWVTDGALRVEGLGERDDAWWQVAAAVAWSHLDATGARVDTSRLEEAGSAGPSGARDTVAP